MSQTAVKQAEEFDNEAFNRYMDELPDMLVKEEEEGTGEAPDGIMPDGTYYDWDYDLLATVETAPDGRRYIVKYEKGRGLVRVQELTGSATNR